LEGFGGCFLDNNQNQVNTMWYIISKKKGKWTIIQKGKGVGGGAVQIWLLSTEVKKVSNYLFNESV
jgi:hypothetical protein